MKTVVILVDLQNSFLKGGALAVPNGSNVLPFCARLAQALPAVATKDWHPPTDPSFQVNGGEWPEHCVVGTRGAEFPDFLRATDALTNVKAIFHKVGYSGFEDTGLYSYLKGLEVERVIVCGLALDFCVKATALDAKRCGFEVAVALDATAAVFPEKAAEVVELLNTRGILVDTTAALLDGLSSKEQV